MEGEDNKQRIIEKAIEMFNSYGCKGVTMDQIASSLRISKRTLYETFANKETLLLDCLTEVHRRIGKKHLEVYNQADDPLLLTIHIIKSTVAHNGRYAHLLQDSERYYPEINNAILERFIDKLSQVLHSILSQAAEKGDLHATVDIDVAVNTITTTINRIYQSGHTTDPAYISTLKDSIYTYLRGLLSLPAIERYDKREQEFKALLAAQDFEN
ncbi:MAG: TetR/AcrR family transcriptional regulator [Bacteroidales bacterium]|jgi:AcrR family transcriptional regulator|nr:TetR/AcrR family transcriptional regulator [Bacteroidales bacterium]